MSETWIWDKRFSTGHYAPRGTEVNTLTPQELLEWYMLAEAYKGDRGSDQYNPTLEGFTRFMETRLKLGELSIEVETEGVENEEISGFPTDV